MTLSSSQVILLSVSEFAAICRTTPRTIRFYEKAGIIHPAHIHPENSYRYYDEKQTEDVFQIKLLKNFGMSLDEIKNIQKNHVSKVIQDEVKKREEELDEKQKEVAFLKRIKSLLFEKESLEKKLQYETIGPVTLFCYRIKNGRYDRIAEYFELLHTTAEKLKLETQVEELTTYLDATYNPNSSDIEVSVMCKIPQTVLTLPKNFYFRTLRKTKVFSFTYQGPYSYLYFIYQKMDEYIMRTKKASLKNTFEIYLNSMKSTSQYDYLTKVCYVVEKTKSNF